MPHETPPKTGEPLVEPAKPKTDWLGELPRIGDGGETEVYLAKCGREMMAMRGKELTPAEQARALRIVAAVTELTGNWPEDVPFPKNNC